MFFYNLDVLFILNIYYYYINIGLNLADIIIQVKLCLLCSF
jgi:hypothetical protein